MRASAPTLTGDYIDAADRPSGRLAAPLVHDLHHVAAQGGDRSELAAVQSGLRAWCTRLCLAIAADLSEAEADFDGAEPAK